MGVNESIRPLQQWRWNRETERLGGLEADDEIELRRLLVMSSVFLFKFQHVARCWCRS